jgi:copper chaperone CopZ
MRGAATMSTTTSTYTVQGMTCAHCVRAVTEELGKLDHVNAVRVDLASGQVSIESDGPLDQAVVAEAVDVAGYSLAP